VKETPHSFVQLDRVIDLIAAATDDLQPAGPP
jgi:hypothetical protein